MKKLYSILTVLLVIASLTVLPACDDKPTEPSLPNGGSSETDKGENSGANGTVEDSENGKPEDSTTPGSGESDIEDENNNDTPPQSPPSDPSDPYENDKHWELP